MYARSILLLVATTGLAQAQYATPTIPQVNPYSGGIAGINQNVYPPISPYLNLLRGNSPVVNYLFDVQPALDAQQQYQSFAARPFQIGSMSPLRTGFFMSDPTGITTQSVPKGYNVESTAGSFHSTGRPATYFGSGLSGLNVTPPSSTLFGTTMPSRQSQPKPKK